MHPNKHAYMKMKFRCTSEQDDMTKVVRLLLLGFACLAQSIKELISLYRQCACVIGYCLVIGLLSNRVKGVGEKVSECTQLHTEMH